MNSLVKSGSLWTALLVALFCSGFYGAISAGGDTQDGEKHTQDNQNSVQDQDSDQDQEEKPLTEEEIKQQELFDRLSKPVKTAEELIARLNESHEFFGFAENQLNQEESKKAIEALRKIYPFESLRERMSFQEKNAVVDSKMRTQKASQNKKNKSGVKVYHTSLRAEALAELHSYEVSDFINRPGNGISRSRVVSPYELKLHGRYASNLNTRDVDSSLLGEPIVPLRNEVAETSGNPSFQERYSLTKSGMPTKELAQGFHQSVSYGFASRYSMGLIRSLDEVAGFESHQVRLRDDWNGRMRMYSFENVAPEEMPDGADISWNVNRLQLVSLLLHDEPRVYVTENLPNMEELNGKDVETRALNDFETEAIEKLRKGEELHTRATPNRIIMVGALRASSDCRQCHDVKANELLGAFSYEFLRDPKTTFESEIR